MADLTRHLRPRPRAAYLMPVCAFIILAVAGVLAKLALTQHDKLDALTRQAAHLREAQAVRPAPAASSADLDDRKRWAAYRAERDFAWPPIFAGLQAAADADIELLEFQPDKVGRRLLLRGEAKSEEALLSFLAALANQPPFQNVHLSHRKTRVRGQLVTVSFEIKAGILPNLDRRAGN